MAVRITSTRAIITKKEKISRDIKCQSAEKRDSILGPSLKINSQNLERKVIISTQEWRFHNLYLP